MPGKQFKTEAVILDTTDVFDADRSFLLFTRELGKVRARAKGVRRPTSKLTGHLLPYLPSQLELQESGGWFLVIQAQIISRYSSGQPYPENPVLFLQQAAVLAESLNRLFQDLDAHPAVYEGLVYTLDRLREICQENLPHLKKKSQLIAAEFLVKCLAELGYRPELEKCVVTGQKISQEFIGWSSQLGGVLAREGYGRAAGDSTVLRHPQTVVALRQFLQPYFMAEKLGMPDEVQEEVTWVTEDYLQTQIGQPLKSLQHPVG